MKKPSIELKKYNFKWENISPTSIGDNIKTTNVYSELIICGASGGVAIKSIDDDQNSWRIINKASDGTAINNIKSAKILQSKLSIFTSGNGYFVDNEGEVTRKTSENSSLPSNNINRLKAFSSVNGRTIESFYACTDKGLYNGIIDDDEDYAIITTTEGLPSNNVIDFAINNSYCIYVTDRGLASSKTTVPLNNKINIISNISFIKNDEFLFVATEFDFSSKEKTCFVVTSTNKVATSFDNGDTWENMTPPNLDNRKITCVTVDDSTIYIGTNDGLFISHKNKKIWYHYKKEDGLSGNIITDISIDVQDGKAIVVSTENGLNKGVFFNWSISTIPEVNEIFSLVKVVDGLQTTGVFFAGTDNGLYKSQDDCVTWTNVYNKNPVLSLASSPFGNGMLFVGTAGDGLFIYYGAKSISKKTIPDFKYTTSNGLISNNVAIITPWLLNIFSQKIFIGYSDSVSISYIDNYDENWDSFNLSLNNLPLAIPNSIKILNNKLYICTTDYENQGAFLAISKEELSLDIASKNILFNIALQTPSTAILQDIDLVDNNVFVTSMNYEGGGFSPVDVRFSSETDLTNWSSLENNAFYGDGKMATDNGILYINELYSLVCYDKKFDEQKTYPKPSSNLQPAPLIKNNILYLLVNNEIHYSYITSFY